MHDEFTDPMGPLPDLVPGEYILWRGKPKKSAYIANNICVLLPLVLPWAIVDFTIFGFAMTTEDSELRKYILLFLLFHMLPVWLWLAHSMTSWTRWKNEGYYLTNKRVIIRKGLFNICCDSVFLRDVHNVHTHYGFVDKMFGSGDVYINHQVTRAGKHRRTSGWYLRKLADPGMICTRIEQAALEAAPAAQEEETCEGG